MTAEKASLMMGMYVIFVHDGVSLLQMHDYSQRWNPVWQSPGVLMGTELVRIGFLSALDTNTHTNTHTVPLPEKLLSEEESRWRGERFMEEVRRNL